jgi:uncharacterized membrane protein YgaE (UPF0421/DUF939 family)
MGMEHAPVSKYTNIILVIALLMIVIVIARLLKMTTGIVSSHVLQQCTESMMESALVL